MCTDKDFEDYRTHRINSLEKMIPCAARAAIETPTNTSLFASIAANYEELKHEYLTLAGKAFAADISCAIAPYLGYFGGDGI